MEVIKGYIPGIFRHPVGAGLATVALIGLAILVFGTRLVTNDFLDDVESRQIRQIAHLSETLHYSGLLSRDRDTLRQRFAGTAASSEFDEFIRRSIFGLDIARVDIYALDGTRLYTTDRHSASPSLGESDYFKQARRGVPVSPLQHGLVLSDASGATKSTDVLTTFALIEDAPPDEDRGGRPLAVFAIYGDVGDSLTSLRTTIWYVVGVFFVGLAVIFVIVYRVSEASRKRLQDALAALQTQYRAVRESRERMLEADEAAKRAIAEELHGTVQTKLYAVWMKLTSVAGRARDLGREEADELDRIVDEVDAIREDDIRNLSHRLHPAIVRVGALAGLRSLRDYYDQLIPVDLEVADAAADLESVGISEIPERIRLATYRIAELALGNVVKHAAATRCVMRWDYDLDAGILTLSVSDDGVGFDYRAGIATGIGLVTIADYVDALGGSFKIASHPGEGTRLQVNFAFHRPARDPGQATAAWPSPEARAAMAEESGPQGGRQSEGGAAVLAEEVAGD